MNQKEAYLNFCQTFVEDRLTRIHTNIANIQESLTSETKSSAGDKHETGRAMLQLEREKLGQQLAEAEKMQLTLTKVFITKSFETVQLGSWVKTSKANYFLAISAGEYTDVTTSVYCISIQTPIAKLLLGKSLDDTVTFNGSNIKILEIL
ncbi:GreA/GreB family elongation factor [Aurantibacter crassamenti]|uniref:GreA/GreB family elongation factor n=1 Tax=Aurantibacter crassamenti TaxID=1837375 RepID=UPI00193A8CF6|nr:GreA/GreB family elongation factor [Aurantibacter crassamenti]MBM1105091.1 GreA/GreB family elongation factor [Aurantibacter crassamenti]